MFIKKYLPRGSSANRLYVFHFASALMSLVVAATVIALMMQIERRSMNLVNRKMEDLLLGAAQTRDLAQNSTLKGLQRDLQNHMSLLLEASTTNAERMVKWVKAGFGLGDFGDSGKLDLSDPFHQEALDAYLQMLLTTLLGAMDGNGAGGGGGGGNSRVSINGIYIGTVDGYFRGMFTDPSNPNRLGREAAGPGLYGGCLVRDWIPATETGTSGCVGKGGTSPGASGGGPWASASVQNVTCDFSLKSWGWFTDALSQDAKDAGSDVSSRWADGVWTPVYLAVDGRGLVMTYAEVIYNSSGRAVAVVAADVSVLALSVSLQKAVSWNSTGSQMLMVIFEEDGDVLSSSDLNITSSLDLIDLGFSGGNGASANVSTFTVTERLNVLEHPHPFVATVVSLYMASLTPTSVPQGSSAALHGSSLLVLNDTPPLLVGDPSTLPWNAPPPHYGGATSTVFGSAPPPPGSIKSGGVDYVVYNQSSLFMGRLGNQVFFSVSRHVTRNQSFRLLALLELQAAPKAERKGHVASIVFISLSVVCIAATFYHHSFVAAALYRARVTAYATRDSFVMGQGGASTREGTERSLSSEIDGQSVHKTGGDGGVTNTRSNGPQSMACVKPPPAYQVPVSMLQMVSPPGGKEEPLPDPDMPQVSGWRRLGASFVSLVKCLFMPLLVLLPLAPPPPPQSRPQQDKKQQEQQQQAQPPPTQPSLLAQMASVKRLPHFWSSLAVFGFLLAIVCVFALALVWRLQAFSVLSVVRDVVVRGKLAYTQHYMNSFFLDSQIGPTFLTARASLRGSAATWMSYEPPAPVPWRGTGIQLPSSATNQLTNASLTGGSVGAALTEEQDVLYSHFDRAIYAALAVLADRGLGSGWVTSGDTADVTNSVQAAASSMRVNNLYFGLPSGDFVGMWCPYTSGSNGTDSGCYFSIIEHKSNPVFRLKHRPVCDVTEGFGALVVDGQRGLNVSMDVHGLDIQGAERGLCDPTSTYRRATAPYADQGCSYDPTVRQWYTRAAAYSTPVWSDVYTFATNSTGSTLGLTFGVPLLNVSIASPSMSASSNGASSSGNNATLGAVPGCVGNGENGKSSSGGNSSATELLGVWASDVSLRQIQDVLAALAQGLGSAGSGRIMVVDDHNLTLISSSHDSSLEASGSASAIKIFESKDADVAATGEFLLGISKDGNLSAHYDSFTWLLRDNDSPLTFVFPMTISRGLHWMVVATTPRSDFFADWDAEYMWVFLLSTSLVILISWAVQVFVAVFAAAILQRAAGGIPLGTLGDPWKMALFRKRPTADASFGRLPSSGCAGDATLAASRSFPRSSSSYSLDLAAAGTPRDVLESPSGSDQGQGAPGAAVTGSGGKRGFRASSARVGLQRRAATVGAVAASSGGQMQSLQKLMGLSSTTKESLESVLTGIIGNVMLAAHQSWKRIPLGPGLPDVDCSRRQRMLRQLENGAHSGRALLGSAARSWRGSWRVRSHSERFWRSSSLAKGIKDDGDELTHENSASSLPTPACPAGVSEGSSYSGDVVGPTPAVHTAVGLPLMIKTARPGSCPPAHDGLKSPTREAIVDVKESPKVVAAEGAAGKGAGKGTVATPGKGLASMPWHQRLFSGATDAGTPPETPLSGDPTYQQYKTHLLKRAVQHIKEGDASRNIITLCDLDSLDSHAYARAYALVTSPHWRAFLAGTLFIHLLVSFWLPEDNKALRDFYRDQPDGSHGGRDGGSSSSSTFLGVTSTLSVTSTAKASLLVVQCLELLCLLIESVSVSTLMLAKYYWAKPNLLNMDNLAARLFDSASVALLALLLIDWALRMGAHFSMEYYVPLRALLVITLNRNMRDSLTMFIRSLIDARDVLLLIGLVLVLSGMYACILFGRSLNVDEFENSFTDIGRSIITMFVLITTAENYGDVVYPASLVYPGAVAFFIFWSTIGLLLLLALTIGTLQQSFGNLAHENRITRRVYYRTAVAAAFALVDVDGSGSLDEEEVVNFMKLYRPGSEESRLRDAFGREAWREAIMQRQAARTAAAASHGIIPGASNFSKAQRSPRASSVNSGGGLRAWSLRPIQEAKPPSMSMSPVMAAPNGADAHHTNNHTGGGNDALGSGPAAAKPPLVPRIPDGGVPRDVVSLQPRATETASADSSPLKKLSLKPGVHAHSLSSPVMDQSALDRAGPTVTGASYSNGDTRPPMGGHSSQHDDIPDDDGQASTIISDESSNGPSNRLMDAAPGVAHRAPPTSLLAPMSVAKTHPGSGTSGNLRGDALSLTGGHFSISTLDASLSLARTLSLPPEATPRLVSPRFSPGDSVQLAPITKSCSERLPDSLLGADADADSSFSAEDRAALLCVDGSLSGELTNSAEGEVGPHGVLSALTSFSYSLAGPNSDGHSSMDLPLIARDASFSDAAPREDGRGDAGWAAAAVAAVRSPHGHVKEGSGGSGGSLAAPSSGDSVTFPVAHSCSHRVARGSENALGSPRVVASAAAAAAATAAASAAIGECSLSRPVLSLPPTSPSSKFGAHYGAASASLLGCPAEHGMGVGRAGMEAMHVPELISPRPHYTGVHHHHHQSSHGSMSTQCSVALLPGKSSSSSLGTRAGGSIDLGSSTDDTDREDNEFGNSRHRGDNPRASGDNGDRGPRDDSGRPTVSIAGFTRLLEDNSLKLRRARSHLPVQRLVQGVLGCRSFRLLETVFLMVHIFTGACYGINIDSLKWSTSSGASGQDHSRSLPVDGINFFLTVFFLARVGLTVLAYGPVEYWWYHLYRRRHRGDHLPGTERCARSPEDTFRRRALAVLALITIMLLAVSLGTGLDMPELRRLALVIATLRVFLQVPSLRHLLYTVYVVLNVLLGLLPFLGVVMYIYAVWGVMLFRGAERQVGLKDSTAGSFANLAEAMLQLYQLLVGESWNDVMYDAIKKTDWSYCIYFLSFIMLVTLMLSNLILGVVLQAFSTLHKHRNLSLAQASRLVRAEEDGMPGDESVSHSMRRAHSYGVP